MSTSPGRAACWRRSGPGSPPSIWGSRATAAGQLGRIAKRPPLMLVTGSACAAEGRSDVTRQVQILAFDGMEVLDYAGPYEVFNVAGEQTSPAAFQVQTVGVSPRPAGRGGFEVVPVCHYSQAPPADILVIPGGRGTRPLMGDQELLAWIAGRAAGAELVMTVCTGALLAAAAGLLDGLAATTHHGAFAELERAAPTATVVRSVRFVRSAPGSTPRRVSPQALTSRCTSWRNLPASKHGQPPKPRWNGCGTATRRC